MKQFNHYLNEVDIPEKDLDDLIMKTFSIVNDDVKNRLKNEKEIKQGNMHLELLSLLKKEFDFTTIPDDNDTKSVYQKDGFICSKCGEKKYFLITH